MNSVSRSFYGDRRKRITLPRGRTATPYIYITQADVIRLRGFPQKGGNDCAVRASERAREERRNNTSRSARLVIVKNATFIRRALSRARVLRYIIFSKENTGFKALVKRQAQFSGSAAPPRRAAPQRRRRQSCGHFVVEELICKAHFNGIKNLPIREHILLCKYALARRPNVINVEATIADVADADLCIRIIRDAYTKWNGPAFKTPPCSPRLTSLAPASRQFHFLTSQVVNPPNCETERQHGTPRPLTLGVLNSLFIANGIVSSLLNAAVYQKKTEKRKRKREKNNIGRNGFINVDDRKRLIKRFRARSLF